MTAAIFGLIGTILGALITTGYQWFWSARERQDKFRLAALEKRLEVHQEAFSLWRKLLFSLSKPAELSQIVMEGQEWWDNNCLYLDEKSRSSFHKSLLLAWDIVPELKAEGKTKIFKEMNQTGKFLIEGVNLPFLGDIESKRVEEKES
jgi:hypothetical protein